MQEYGREANGVRKAQPEVEYIRGSGMAGGVFGLVYSVRGAEAQPSYNLYNSRGDVVAQTNGTGVFTWQASYEAFGTRTGESGLNRERHRANTKDEDPTGLLNEGMRSRDLETGVWLTRDPAGFVDGPNLYAYVRQNPWSKFDPTGLCEALLMGGGDDVWGYSSCETDAERDAVTRGAQRGTLHGGIAAAAITVATAAALFVAEVGVVAASLAALKEVASEAVDQGVEKATGVPLPATSITGLAKDGLKKLAKEGAREVVGETLEQSAKETVEAVTKNVEHGPYHRLNDKEETLDAVEASGELWGKPPRNVFVSDIPKVKAYDGPLPEGASGFEFKTSVAPDSGHVPGKPTWSGSRPGVKVEEEHAKIPVKVTKQTIRQSSGS